MFPVLKDKYLRDVTRADLLLIQKRIEKPNALSVAEKVRFWLDEIFRYALATDETDSNPASDLVPYRLINIIHILK
ncbi:phage integrase central domain-containing protein [Frischella perrara]|uniref:phage integrase central domain-containing protein n=1 Tax=Frischella perrara TaxID=1267021 RepID=UPI003C6D4E57